MHPPTPCRRHSEAAATVRKREELHEAVTKMRLMLEHLQSQLQSEVSTLQSWLATHHDGLIQLLRNYSAQVGMQFIEI